MAIYGLLIGINHYLAPEVPKLMGCVNDVELLSKTLRERFNTHSDNLVTLLNQEATHQNIIDTFQNHLIERNWQPNDTAVFYFSGHGAQSIAPEIFWNLEPDRFNESLVCHDSRVGGIPDLLDKELRYLIALLAPKCAHIVILLDCCHGGHGSRPSELIAGIRQAPADINHYALNNYVFGKSLIRNADYNHQLLEQVRSANGKHILLAACSDYQFSIETNINAHLGRHGLFTVALCEALSTLQYSISYQELRNRIYQKVQTRTLNQSPQIEAINGAQINQVIFGTELLPLRLLAFKDNEGHWKLNAGSIQGLHLGDRVALFENNADLSHIEVNTIIATIVDIESFQSNLSIENTNLLKQSSYTAIFIHSNLPKMPIKLEGNLIGIQPLKELLIQDETISDAGHFLKESSENPLYTIHFNNNSYTITKAYDTQILFPEVDNAFDVLQQVAVMARWHQKLALYNPSSRLNNPIDIVITYNNERFINQDMEFNYIFDGYKWHSPAFNLELKLKENQPRLYFALLYFDGSTGEISNILASGSWLSHTGSEKEGHFKKQPSIKAYDGRTIPINIKDELLAAGIQKVNDFIKLIICEEEFDSSLLVQQGLTLSNHRSEYQGAFGNILEQLASNTHNRSLALSAKYAPDWTTQIISLIITHQHNKNA